MNDKKRHHTGMQRRALLRAMLAGSFLALAGPPALLYKAAPALAAQGKDKVLTLFYSRSGNTRALAGHIHGLIGGGLVELQTQHPYPDDYRATTEQAKREMESGYLPPLKTEITGLDGYGTILVGSPCWWGTLAPPVRTFLAKNDLSGKTLAPFMTHGGSGLGRTMEDMRKLCPNSSVLQGLAVSGARAVGARDEATAWLRSLGLIGRQA